jgi:hypothetical protein
MAEHSFDIELAQEYGVNAAILFKNICFWIAKNRANGKNFFDGDYWTFNSKRAFAELFPYMSERQVGSALQKLIDARMIKTGNYNEDRRDKTTWYALDINGACMVQKCKSGLTKSYNGNGENVRPLPDSKLTDINTDIKPDNYIPSTTYPEYNNNNNNSAREEQPQKATKEKKPTPERLIIPPTLEMVEAYCKERNNGIDPGAFIDYYAARGWYLNKKQRMVDWHAAVGTWERNAKERQASKPNNTVSYKGEQLVTINGTQYIQRGLKYYLPNGSGVAVDPYAPDDLPY